MQSNYVYFGPPCSLLLCSQIYTKFDCSKKAADNTSSGGLALNN